MYFKQNIIALDSTECRKNSQIKCSMTVINIILVHNKGKFDSDLTVNMCRDMMSIKIDVYRKEESEKRGEESCCMGVKRGALCNKSFLSLVVRP